MNAPVPTSTSRPERLIRAGLGVTLASLAAILVAVSPLVTGVSLSPIWWFLAMSLGLGLGLILIGLAGQSRARSRAVTELLSVRKSSEH